MQTDPLCQIAHQGTLSCPRLSLQAQGEPPLGTAGETLHQHGGVNVSMHERKVEAVGSRLEWALTPQEASKALHPAPYRRHVTAS